MNRINIKAEEAPLSRVTESALLKKTKLYMQEILDYLGKDRWDVSVLFCGSNLIKNLNSRYRKLDEPTDILTFNMGETVRGRFLAGDIAISIETLAGNAEYFGVTPDEELRRLLIHGILHLDGMDHKTSKPAEPMLRLQEKILAELPGEHII